MPLDVEDVANGGTRAGSAKRRNYNWRKKYGGLMPLEMKRLKHFQEGNQRLKKLVADLSLDKEMLQDVIRRKYEACRKREMVDHVCGAWQVSMRRAFRAVPVDRSSYHYRSKRIG